MPFHVDIRGKNGKTIRIRKENDRATFIEVEAILRVKFESVCGVNIGGNGDLAHGRRAEEYVQDVIQDLNIGAAMAKNRQEFDIYALVQHPRRGGVAT